MLRESLDRIFVAAVGQAFPEMAPLAHAEVTPATDAKFGDYQCNLAMKLAKPLQRSPRQVAEAIMQSVQEEPLIGRLEIAGPGFINIHLSPLAISQCVTGLLESGGMGLVVPQPRQRIVIDFSSPNTAKEMHVGHLRSTIIGDALARLFEALDQDVLRLNHIGDWGTAFGMLIAYIKEHAPAVLQGEHAVELATLVQWYRQSKALFDQDLRFRKAAQMEVVALQGGDPEARRAWGLICEVSRIAYQQVYDLLEIRLKERGESFYQPMLAEIVKEFEAKGLVAVSDGARCIFLDGFVNREGDPLPLMVQKSDGGYNYDTTDLAAMKQRIEEEKADRIIIVTDAGQAQHFAMIAAAGEKAGWFSSRPVRFDHVPFGLVLGPDGKKFRTRSGETERLVDLLGDATEAATKMVTERHPDWSQEEITNTGLAIGINAVKYADLVSHRVKDYHYSSERMLRFEGNTAPFLLYSYVRAKSILRRLPPPPKQVTVDLRATSEIRLGILLLQFPEILLSVAEDLLPHRLADYLYRLADAFNAFFRDCHVEGTPEQESRAGLVKLTERILGKGLQILGLRLLERM
ncbi:MAG: arginine--tRNA ligase [Chlamydiia bacterium]